MTAKYKVIWRDGQFLGAELASEKTSVSPITPTNFLIAHAIGAAPKFEVASRCSDASSLVNNFGAPISGPARPRNKRRRAFARCGRGPQSKRPISQGTKTEQSGGPSYSSYPIALF
jgi:hypothetical protein